MQNNIRYLTACFLCVFAGSVFGAQTSLPQNRQQYAPAVFDLTLAYLEKTNQPEPSLQIAQVLLDKAEALAALGDQEAELKTYDALLFRFGDTKKDPLLQELVAQTWFNKGVLLEQMGSLQPAFKAYQTAQHLLRDAAKKTALDLKSRLALNEGLVLFRLQQDDAALLAFDKVIGRAGLSASQKAKPELVVKAMLGKGLVYTQQGKVDKALNIYNAVIAGIEKRGRTPALELLLREALLGKTIVLEHLSQIDEVGFAEALSIYDQVLKSLPPQSLEATLVQGMRADGSLNQALALSEKQRFDAALNVYDQILRNLGKRNEAVLQVPLRKALLNKGFVLWKLGQFEQALGLYDLVFSDLTAIKSRSPSEQDMLVTVIFSKATVFGELQRPREQLAAYEQLEKEIPKSQKTSIQDLLLASLLSKGGVQVNLNLLEDAIDTADAIQLYFGQSTDPAIQVRVATALLNKALLLRSLKRGNEELALYGEMLTRFSDVNRPQLKPFFVQTLHNRGFLYLHNAKVKWNNKTERAHALAQAGLDFETGRRVSAKEQVPNALKTQILQGLAYVRYLQGDEKQARSLLREALKLSAGNVAEYGAPILSLMKSSPNERDPGMLDLLNKTLDSATAR